MTGRLDPPLRSEAVDRLRALLIAEGSIVLDHPQRLRGLLADRLASYRREVLVLVTALMAGVPQRLRGRAAETVDSRLLAELAGELVASHGLDVGHAHWAVEGWATALGVRATVTRDAHGTEPGADRRWYRRPLLLGFGGGLALLVAIVVVVVGSGSPEVTPTPRPSTALNRTSEPTPSFEPSPPPTEQPTDRPTDPPPTAMPPSPTAVIGGRMPPHWPSGAESVWSAFAPAVHDACEPTETNEAVWVECYDADHEVSSQFVIWYDDDAMYNAQPSLRDTSEPEVTTWSCDSGESGAEWRFFDPNGWAHAWTIYYDLDITVEAWSTAGDHDALTAWDRTIPWCRIVDG